MFFQLYNVFSYSMKYEIHGYKYGLSFKKLKRVNITIDK